jgi:hypothetical protein
VLITNTQLGDNARQKVFDAQLNFYKALIGLDLAKPGTDKTVETTWKQEADGTMSVLESKIV